MQIISFTELPKGKMGQYCPTRIAYKDCRFSAADDNGRQGARSLSYSLWDDVRSLSYGAYSPTGTRIVVMYNRTSKTGYAEVQRDKEDGSMDVTVAICYGEAASTIKFKAGEYVNNGGQKFFNKYNAKERKGTAITWAFIAWLLAEDENGTVTHSYLRDLSPYTQYDYDHDFWDNESVSKDFGQYLQVLSSEVYYMSKSVKLPDSFPQIRTTDIPMRDGDSWDGKNKAVSVVCEFVEAKKQEKKEESKIEVGKYRISEKVLSDEEKALVPMFPEGFTAPEWVVNTAKRIKSSSCFTEPFRNVLLTGPAGTGKTTGAMMIASLLGKPYVKETCSPDTDMFALIGQLLPNTGDDEEKMDVATVLANAGLPSFDAVEFDPKGTFKALFGRDMTAYDTVGDMYAELFNRAQAVMQRGKDLKTGKEFVYVESNLIRALENGWVIEIQEPNVIKRQSVLVGLNGIMENNAAVADITLPTGNTIRRNPDAVVIYTTNGNYEGCQDMQQSVLSRCQIVKTIAAPTAEEMSARAANAIRSDGQLPSITSETLLKMAQTILEVDEYCSKNDITDGVCGPRELQNWAKLAVTLQVETDENSAIVSERCLVAAAFETVIVKASQTEEGRDEIINAIFSKKYRDVSEVRTDYDNGLI